MDEEFPRRTIGFFLAPSVAQEMQISVRLSVCPMKSVLEITIFIFLSQVSLRSPTLFPLHRTDGA